MSDILWLNPVRKTLQESAATTGDGTVITLGAKYASAVIQVTGTMGVITFKGTIDGTTWVNLPCVNVTTSVATATAAAVGIYSVSVMGMDKFKAEVTTHTGGTDRISAVGNFLPVPNPTLTANKAWA